MRNYVTNLKITGFKGFQAAINVPFRNLTVLCGANSVGKSTVIQAVLLSRLAIKYKDNENRIPLNGPFLLSLGDTRQVAASRKISFSFDYEGLDKSSILNFIAEVDRNYLSIDKAFTQIKELVVLNAENFHYLNAERIGPRPFYENNISTLPSVGIQGEYAVPILNEGLKFETDSLKNYHKVTNTTFESPNYLVDQVNNWMKFVLPDVKISTNNIQQINKSMAVYNGHTPANVGFGISYVLPIIVAGLIAEKGTMLIVENPEAHLHPFGQSRIGQFLAMIAASDIQVVVETHSEHVINGMRVAAMKDWISHRNILINFLYKDNEDEPLSLNPIEVDGKGDLSDFPIGFFDQSAQDLISLTKIRREKK